MEADGIHGMIKRKLKTRIETPPHVYTPGAMMDVIRSTYRSNLYNVVEPSARDCRNFKELSKDIIGPLHRSFAGIMKSFLISYSKVRTLISLILKLAMIMLRYFSRKLKLYKY